MKLGDKRKNKVEQKDWNIFVATPAYDGKVDTDYSQSLAASAYASPFHHVKFSAAVMGNGAFIDLARNIFVKMFLEIHKEATHLFFIDSDLKFSPDDFIGLARSSLPICAGVYRRREKNENYPVLWSEHPEQGGLWIEDNWLMCDRVPTGFLCISREVIEEMAADARQLTIHGQDGPVPELFYTKIQEDGRFVGEDFCFCDDYIKKYNKKIPVWPNMEFTHGGYTGNFLDWLELEIEKEENTVSAA